MGQVIAVLVAGAGIASTLLAERGVSIPTSQSLLNYVLLAVVYLGVSSWRDGQQAACVQTAPWYVFAVLALIDVEANFLIVKAYAYTSLTSIQILDCWAIPTSMGLSCVVLGAAYSRGHYIGVTIAIAGLAVLVGTDGTSDAGGDAEPQRRLLGDALCIAAATLYAASNVAQELLLRAGVPRTVYLGQLGVWGSIISALQVVLLERDSLAALLASGGGATVLPLTIAFVACLFCMYSLTTVMLPTAGSAAFNLSLLAADLYAVLASQFLFGDSLPYLFWAALCLVVVGLAAYHASPVPTMASNALSLVVARWFGASLPHVRVGDDTGSVTTPLSLRLGDVAIVGMPQSLEPQSNPQIPARL